MGVMFQDALSKADEKDQKFGSIGSAEGDFWGLPSCFKGKLTQPRILSDQADCRYLCC
jgi:hypothetical protein